MNTRSHAFLGGLFGSSLGRTLCGVIAGLALLGSTAAVQADQNGRRDRGARTVQRQVHSQSQNQHQHRQGARHDDRGSRGRGHFDRGRDNRHHNRGHGHHHKSDTKVSIVIGGSVVHGHHRHHAHRHVIYRPARPSYAELEYDRGYSDGKCAGFDAGKADALNWRPYCDSPNVCLDYVSSYYRAGYLDAYVSAYKDGYAAGECARQTVRLRYGSRSVRYRYSSACRY